MAVLGAGTIVGDAAGNGRADGPLDIVADSLLLNPAARLRGDARLTFATRTAGGDISLGDGVAPAGLHLPDASLTTLTDGLAHVTFETLGGNVRVGAASFRNPLTLVSRGGDISFENTLMLVGPNAPLVARADGDVRLLSGATLLSAGHDVTLNADADALYGGSVHIESALILTDGGDITIGGGLDPRFGPAVARLSQEAGVTIRAGVLDAGAAGSILVTGETNAEAQDDRSGVLIDSDSILATQAGSLRVVGTSRAGGASAVGVRLDDAASVLRTADGSLTIIGSGSATGGTDSDGVRISGALVESTASGRDERHGDRRLRRRGFGRAATGGRRHAANRRRRPDPDGGRRQRDRRPRGADVGSRRPGVDGPRRRDHRRRRPRRHVDHDRRHRTSPGRPRPEPRRRHHNPRRLALAVRQLDAGRRR